MSFKSINLMDNANVMMDLIAKRHKALGENLANVDTPGYTRKDVNFNQALSDMGTNSLGAELSTKLGPSPVFEEQTGESVNAGNELMEMQKNSLMYTMATRQMTSIITQMKTAINVGK